MKLPTRTFKSRPAVREQTPLIIGIAGPSGTGKTFSALRLAKGMQRILGGRIAVVDTEAGRALSYADLFDFDHIDFLPPFGPLDYVVAIQSAADQGAKIIIVDSATHEHSGEGGIMDQIDNFLNQKAGDDWKQRDKLNMVAHARFKPQRKYLNNFIVQIGRRGIIVILCYRASDKVKPVAPKDRIDGEAIKHMGVTPETTSPLIYEMTQCYLLKPGADGRPTTKPDTDDERILTKTPLQFREWKTGEQLDESLGEKLASWALGSKARPTEDHLQPEAVALGSLGKDAYDPRPYHLVVKEEVDYVVSHEQARNREFILPVPQVHQHLLKAAIAAGHATRPDGSLKLAKVIEINQDIYRTHRDWVRHELISYLSEQLEADPQVIEASSHQVREPGSNG